MVAVHCFARIAMAAQLALAQPQSAGQLAQPQSTGQLAEQAALHSHSRRGCSQNSHAQSWTELTCLGQFKLYFGAGRAFGDACQWEWRRLLEALQLHRQPWRLKGELSSWRNTGQAYGVSEESWVWVDPDTAAAHCCREHTVTTRAMFVMMFTCLHRKQTPRKVRPLVCHMLTAMIAKAILSSADHPSLHATVYGVTLRVSPYGHLDGIEDAFLHRSKGFQELWAQKVGQPMLGMPDIRLGSRLASPRVVDVLLFLAESVELAPHWFAAVGALFVAKTLSLLAILLEHKVWGERDTTILPSMRTKGGQHRRADTMNIIAVLTEAREVGGHMPTLKRTQKSKVSLPVNNQLTNTRCREHMLKTTAAFAGAEQWCTAWDLSTHGAETNVLVAYSRDVDKSAYGPIMHIDKPPRSALHYDMLLEHLAAGNKIERVAA